MRKSIYTESTASNHLTSTSPQPSVAARVARLARYVGLAIYMIDPIHGAADLALITEYSNFPPRERGLPQRRSPV